LSTEYTTPFSFLGITVSVLYYSSVFDPCKLFLLAQVAIKMELNILTMTCASGNYRIVLQKQLKDPKNASWLY
jgi:hypothetical protein